LELPGGDLLAQQRRKLQVQRFTAVKVQAHLITVTITRNHGTSADDICLQVITDVSLDCAP